ncbi:glycosyltransferase family 25 protein [Trichothermofontia sichuanensis B231]|uniref:glycosyltransferase family 25 protein n=1 Tax=Trichothermofontia sichuanensis TaxID=3045816 RepID=UPI002245B4AD|nr:glycosyltransferase family 25 protein [Trichothermofontia sichuanensis]UZQ55744.1 glycosyltransferase family 25 protein [Trichothermofontia sichuanensis B231]
MSKSPLLSFFDRSYIINLPERFDRRNQMKQELKMLGLSELSEEVIFFPAIRPTDKGEFPSIGSKGCFLSHLAILKEAKSQNLNNLLIMEDDLSFTRFLVKKQDTIVDELRRLSWDFAYLGHGVNWNSGGGQIFHEYSEPLALTHFFAVNKRTIAELVDFLEEVLKRPAGHPEGGPMHIDGAYSTFRKQHPEVITLIACPSLGFQRASSSDVTGYKWFERLPILAQPLGAARDVKNWYRRNFTS